MEIKVERADGLKCPRCWKYHGIQENYQGICDRCAEAIITSDPDDYMDNRSKDKEGNFTQTEEDFRAGFKALQADVKEAYRRQYEKYAVKK
jgi:hypothetical protein